MSKNVQSIGQIGMTKLSLLAPLSEAHMCGRFAGVTLPLPLSKILENGKDKNVLIKSLKKERVAALVSAAVKL